MKPIVYVGLAYAAITVYRIGTKGSTEPIWRQALWPIGLLLGASAR